MILYESTNGILNAALYSYFFLFIFYRYMDPGDPSNMDQADAKINVNKEVALEAKIKKELDDLIDDFDEDDEEDDIFKGEDFESSEDFEDDSDSDYKSSLRSGARRIKKEIPEQLDDGSGIPCQSSENDFPLKSKVGSS